MRSAVNRITVRGTDGTERTFTLQGGNLVIGRDPACGICLQDSQVSWQHAVLNDAGGTCIIEDLGSSNGTFVGAARIQRQVLSAGEIVRIGPFEIALQMRAAPSPTSASEQTMFDMAAFRVAAPIVNRPAHEQTATQRKLRFTQLSESYRTANLRQEALAGLTVAALLVPQGMAYAQLAGMPAVTWWRADSTESKRMTSKPARSSACALPAATSSSSSTNTTAIGCLSLIWMSPARRHGEVRW